MRTSARRLAWVLGPALLAIVFVPPVRATLPGKFSADFICYWTAGKLLASGQNPYDVALQTRLQRDLGWDRERDGLGVLAFLPYYYPPWFGLLFTVLLPLGYATAKAAFVVINIELLILTGLLLRGATPVVPRYLPAVIVPLFVFSVVAVILGQTSPLVFFLIVAAWRLLESGRDRAAGVVLAWLTIKPQLTGMLVLGLLIWATRRRRWGVVTGFAATLAALGLVCTLIVPGWPVAMLRATRQTPPPTVYFPWIGTSWFLLLTVAGLKRWRLWALFAPVALGAVAIVVRAALDRGRPLRDVLALGLLAIFFVTPYGRHYDFPVLLVPFLVLVGTRLPEWAGAALLVALLVLPYLQYGTLGPLKSWMGITGRFNLEFTFSWVPLVLAAVWGASRRRAGPGGVNPG